MTLSDQTPESAQTVVDPSVLAERRARRAELGEDALRTRAVQAEQRVADVSAALAVAEDERARLAARLASTERELTLSRQREFAEQRARIDAEGEAGVQRRATARELTRLRGALAAAEARAEELEAELDELRAEPAVAPADLEELEGARAQITLLRCELDRRADAQEALEAQVAAQQAAFATAVERATAVLQAGVVPAPALVLPPRDHPALASATPSPAASQTLVVDISRAAERLRAERPAGTASSAPSGVAAVAEAAAPAADGPRWRRWLRRR